MMPQITNQQNSENEKFCQIFTKLIGRKKKEGESYRLKKVQGEGEKGHN